MGNTRVEPKRFNLLGGAVTLCFCAMSVLFALFSFYNLVRGIEGFLRIFLVLMGALLLMIGIGVFAYKVRIPKRSFGFWLFIAVLLVRVVFALLVDTRPESDFSLMYEAAVKLAQGVNILNDSAYFSTWAYQSVFVVWMAFFIRLFGAGVVFFKLTNCVFSALTALLIYKAAGRFASEGGARMAGMVFAVYPGAIMLTSVLTPQHISEFLLLASVYVLTAAGNTMGKRLWISAAAGLLLALGNAFRPVGIIVVVAVVLLLVIQLISRLRAGISKIMPLILSALIFVGIFFAASAGMSGLAKVSGLNEQGLTNGLPEWKFVVGLNRESGGVYNHEDESAVFGKDVDSKAAAKALLDARLSMSPGDFLKLFSRKSLTMWGDFEPSFWAFTSNVFEGLTDSGTAVLSSLITKTVYLAGALYIIINLLTATGAWGAFRKKRADSLLLLLCLIALIYFGSHAFIEVQTRYRSLMTMMTMPLLALGGDTLIAFTNNRRLHRRR